MRAEHVVGKVGRSIRSRIASRSSIMIDPPYVRRRLGFGDHPCVGVAERMFGAADDVLHDRGAARDLPQRPPRVEARSTDRLRQCEAEQVARLRDLVGGLAEQDAGLGVGEEPSAILAVLVPSSAWARRSDRRWITATLATP